MVGACKGYFPRWWTRPTFHPSAPYRWIATPAPAAEARGWRASPLGTYLGEFSRPRKAVALSLTDNQLHRTSSGYCRYSRKWLPPLLLPPCDPARLGPW